MKTLWKKYTFLLIAMTTLSFGCSNDIENNAEHQTATKQSFSLVPKTISNDSVLNINLPANHPKKLSIKTPEGNWLVVHSPEDHIFVLTEQAFEATKYLQISAKTTKGLLWKNGQSEIVTVFNQPGEYTIYLADNLETEPENTFHFMDTVILK